jgi:hypothetical protein
MIVDNRYGALSCGACIVQQNEMQSEFTYDGTSEIHRELVAERSAEQSYCWMADSHMRADGHIVLDDEHSWWNTGNAGEHL